jgi:hypothetical protein
MDSFEPTDYEARPQEIAEVAMWAIQSASNRMQNATRDLRMEQEAIAARIRDISAEFEVEIEEAKEVLTNVALINESSYKTSIGSVTYKRASERRGWDSDALEAMADILPEILDARKITQIDASVTVKLAQKI